MLAEQLAKKLATKDAKKSGDDDAAKAFTVLADALGVPKEKRGSAEAALARYLECLEDLD